MKRLAAYLALLVALVTLEASIPILPGLHALHPILHLPLILFFALRLGTVEGAVLSAIAGVLVDITVPYPLGLATFTDVSLFVTARVLLAGIRTEGWLIESIFAFLLAAQFHATAWGLRRVFDVPMASLDGTPWLRIHLVACLTTAAVTPLVFRLGRGIEGMQARAPGFLS